MTVVPLHCLFSVKSVRSLRVAGRQQMCSPAAGAASKPGLQSHRLPRACSLIWAGLLATPSTLCSHLPTAHP